MLGCFFGSSTNSCLYIFYYLKYFRSSCPEVFLGKSVLKTCSKFTGEQPCRSVISIKLERKIYKCSWSNPSICSFNYNIPSLSAIICTPFLFSAYINHIYIVCSLELSGIFIFPFASLYFLNTLSTQTNTLGLIYESM